jgi:hypothetical protein
MFVTVLSVAVDPEHQVLCAFVASNTVTPGAADTFSSFINSFITYLLTSCSTVLKKLTGFQLVKEFPPFYGTRRFVTAFTSARHLFLS